MPTRDQWHVILERQLPPATSPIARNRAITARYARWYLQEPWLFKWAGMAAFASAQVGIGLALMEMIDAPHDALRPAHATLHQEPGLLELLRDVYGRGLDIALFVPISAHDTATHQLRQDLELIRQANEAIFRDTGWAHLAYIRGGLAAVEACLTDAEDAQLRDAFRLLDEGVQKLCHPSTYDAGRILIDQGAVTMLRHEQMTILPPYMERMSDLGRRLASLGSWLAFEGAVGMLEQPSFSAYFGPLAVLLGTRSITNTADRWQWIEHDVLPKWAQLNGAYGEGCPLQHQLLAMADEQTNLLQQTASVMHTGYAALGLRLGAASIA